MHMTMKLTFTTVVLSLLAASSTTASPLFRRSSDPDYIVVTGTECTPGIFVPLKCSPSDSNACKNYWADMGISEEAASTQAVVAAQHLDAASATAAPAVATSAAAPSVAAATAAAVAPSAAAPSLDAATAAAVVTSAAAPSVAAATAAAVATSEAAPSVAAATAAATSAAATPSAAAANKGTSSDTSGTTYTGALTFYYPAGGLGACGSAIQNTDLVCALSGQLYDSFGLSVASAACGKTAIVQLGGKSVQVTIKDRCAGCQLNDIDCTPAVFDQLADPSQGRVSGATFYFV